MYSVEIKTKITQLERVTVLTGYKTHCAPGCYLDTRSSKRIQFTCAEHLVVLKSRIFYCQKLVGIRIPMEVQQEGNVYEDMRELQITDDHRYEALQLSDIPSPPKKSKAPRSRARSNCYQLFASFSVLLSTCIALSAVILVVFASHATRIKHEELQQTVDFLLKKLNSTEREIKKHHWEPGKPAFQCMLCIACK